jgi:hypothetical protein
MNTKLLFHLVVLFVVVSGILGGCCQPALIGSLPVQLHPQQTNMWCWAASGEMVMDYLGHDVAQCVEANNRFARKDCCTIQLCPNPVAAHPCVRGGWPEFGKYGFSFKKTTNAPLSWEDLREQISNMPCCKKRPFCFTWYWAGGGGHMMVAKGYFTLGGTNYVAVLDPWAPCQGDEYIITYDYYVESIGNHTHWDDYYDVKYEGGI